MNISREKHHKDMLFPMREEYTPASKSGNTTTRSTEKSPYREDEEEVEDMFANSYRHGSQYLSTQEHSRAAASRQRVSRYAGDEPAYQSMPTARYYDGHGKEVASDDVDDDGDDLILTATTSCHKPKLHMPVAKPTHREMSQKPKSRNYLTETSTEPLDPGCSGLCLEVLWHGAGNHCE